MLCKFGRAFGILMAGERRGRRGAACTQPLWVLGAAIETSGLRLRTWAWKQQFRVRVSVFCKASALSFCRRVAPHASVGTEPLTNAGRYLFPNSFHFHS